MKFKFTVIFSTLSLAFLFTFQACVPKSDPIPEDYAAGEDVGLTTGLLSNIFEMVVDVAETRADTIKTKPTLFTNISTAEVVFTDSVTTDGDGLEYNIVFGIMDSTTFTGGVDCIDNRRRAGTLYVKQSDFFSAAAKAKIEVEMRDDSASHYIGGAPTIVKITGKLVVEKTAAGKYSVTFTDGKAKYPNGLVAFEAAQTMDLKDDKGPGSWNDVYTMSGTGTGKTRENTEYSWFTTSALEKRNEDVCSRIYVTGKIEVRDKTKNAALSVNFDHKFNAACDRIFAVTLINGHFKEYKVN